MVFPVLQLPAVAFSQVLRGFTSSDLFEMHQCSLKTGGVLRNYERQNKTVKVTVDFQRKWVDVKGVRRYNLKTAEENQGVVPDKLRKFYYQDVPTEVTDDEKTFNTFWKEEDDKIEGLMTITNDLIQSLGLGQLESVLLDKGVSAQQVLTWIGQCGLKMENFNLIDTVAGQEDAVADLIYSDEFLRKVSMNFISLFQVSAGYTPKNLTLDKCIDLYHLFLQHSHWFTLNHLMGFNTGLVVLYHSKLSSSDVNEYLKLWKEQNYTRLTYMSIHLAEGYTFDIKAITAGLVDPKDIRIEEDNTFVVDLKRPDKAGAELVLNAGKNELSFFVDDIPKP